MAYVDYSTKGMAYVPLRQIVDDFLLTVDEDDYTANVSDVTVRNLALRGIREFGFDVTTRVKSVKRTIESNDTITLPEDFVGLIKVGIVDTDGVIRVMRENKNINFSQKIIADRTEGSLQDSEGYVDGANNDVTPPLMIQQNADLIQNREDSKGSTAGQTGSSSEELREDIFRNYLYENTLGALYGLGGGVGVGEYRLNLDQFRIEVATNSNTTEVIIEYISDEARSTNPLIHVYAEEALRSYVYYKVCERKRNVPASEKARSRAEYYNERRKARARMNSISKDDILGVVRKNFKQAPKY
tara:strand:+ start:9291 stop:10190 length:900 start_codon:yes stop_codon:yes gene_type:complete